MSDRYDQSRSERNLARTGEDLLMSPFSMMRRMADEMNQLLSNTGMSAITPSNVASMIQGAGPRVDLCENDDAYVVEAELPGIDPNNVEIQVTGNVLSIRGETQREEAREEQGYHISERRFGSFRREVNLPGSVNPDSARADYRNGILEITLPKTEQNKGRRIPVSGGGQSSKSSDRSLGGGGSSIDIGGVDSQGG